MGNRKLFFQFHIYVNIAVPPSILIPCIKLTHQGFPDGSGGKESACNAGDRDSIPESGRSPGERNGNPLQYPCLENSMDKGAWWATVYGVPKRGT